MLGTHLCWLTGISLLVLAGTGCGTDEMPLEAPSPGTPSDPIVSRIVAGLDAEGWRLVGLGLAKALADDSLRRDLRQAWRDSRVTEHKLEFPGFARTEVGIRLLQRAAQHIGVDMDVLLAAVRQASPVDFYMPAREHRLTWRGSHDLLVTTNFVNGPPWFGFNSKGERIAIDPRAAPIPARPVAVLQPAELKLERIRLQRNATGETIQDEDDGDIGIGRAAVPGGDAAALEPWGRSVPLAKCTDNCGGGGGTHYNWTYLTAIQTSEDVCDNGFCWETNEFEFHASVASGVTGMLRITGVPSEGTIYLDDLVIYADPATAGLINIQVKETDNWGDDIWLVVRYLPNYVGPVDLTAPLLNQWFHLKENPHVGVPDPYRLAVKFAAH